MEPMAENAIETLSTFIVEALYAAKANGAAHERTPVAAAFYNGRVQTLERLNIFLARLKASKEELTMDKAKLELGDLISIDELPRREKEDSLQKALLEVAPTVKPCMPPESSSRASDSDRPTMPRSFRSARASARS